MSATDDSIEETRRSGSPDRRHMLGMLRRMVVKVTSGPFWQAMGVLLIDNVTKETRKTEIFSGIGFYSRPAPGVNAEEIVGFVGGSENPVVLATRDEDTRKKVAKLQEDETAIYNTKAIAVIKKDGTIELRRSSGVPESALRAQTYRSAEDTMLLAVKAAIALISNIPGLTAPQIAIVAAATEAIDTFRTAAATYLSTVVKVQ